MKERIDVRKQEKTEKKRGTGGGKDRRSRRELDRKNEGRRKVDEFKGRRRMGREVKVKGDGEEGKTGKLNRGRKRR